MSYAKPEPNNQIPPVSDAPSGAQEREQKEGDCAGLIHQAIPDVAETEPRLQRVQVTDRTHPHFEEYGRFTGKIITMRFSGESMAEVKLENCRHGSGACFVGKGQVTQVGDR